MQMVQAIFETSLS